MSPAIRNAVGRDCRHCGDTRRRSRRNSSSAAPPHLERTRRQFCDRPMTSSRSAEARSGDGRSASRDLVVGQHAFQRCLVPSIGSPGITRKLTLALLLAERVDRAAGVQHRSRRRSCAVARCRTDWPRGARPAAMSDRSRLSAPRAIVGELAAFHLRGALEEGAGVSLRLTGKLNAESGSTARQR